MTPVSQSNFFPRQVSNLIQKFSGRIRGKRYKKKEGEEERGIGREEDSRSGGKESGREELEKNETRG